MASSERLSTGSPQRADRVTGMLLGAAVGDALGWPQEARGGMVGGKAARERSEPVPVFRSWTRTSGFYARRYTDPVGAGEYSDDTQLLCSTARACTAGNHWWDVWVRVELPAWRAYQRGGGRAVLAASSSWADGRAPWEGGHSSKAAQAVTRYRQAGGNGVAMRIAPHAVVVRSPGELADRVLADGLSTHGHPRALVGALCYASAMHAALDGHTTLEYGGLIEAARTGLLPPRVAVGLLPEGWGDPSEVEQFRQDWDRTCGEMHALLGDVASSLARGSLSRPEETLAGLGCFDPQVNGAGTVTAAGALYLASRFAARPLSGLLTASYLPDADTDTLASMTAALLGAVHADQWLGSLAHDVQDADYLRELAWYVHAGEPHGYRPLSASPATMRRRMLAQLPPDGSATEGEFVDGRGYQVGWVEPISDGKALRVRLRLSDGQTVVVDRTLSGRYARSVRVSTPARAAVAVQPKGEEQPQLPMEVPSLGSAVPGVTLGSAQLHRSVAFYARLLDVEIPVVREAAQVAPWLRLAASSEPAAGPVQITLLVADLQDAYHRVAGASMASDGTHFRIRDPDGRRVLVTETPARARDGNFAT